MQPARSAILDYAFRPFFLLLGLFSVAAISLWILVLHGVGDGVIPGAGVLWHAHEMLFGFAMAAIAGFSLTAVATWTQRPPIRGNFLLALVLTWLAGRWAMLAPDLLPPFLFAAMDLGFPFLLAFVLGREIIAAANWRNLPVVMVILMLAAVNLAWHAAVLAARPELALMSISVGLHFCLALIAIIAGRIVPSFTANWLRQRGTEVLPSSAGRVAEAVVVPVTLAAGAATTWAAQSPLAAALAAAAACLHAWRLFRWRGLAARAEPLVFVLHVAYAWLPIGYALLLLQALGWPLPSSAAIHALAMGGVGSMILAVTTRVALGHTGRPLTAARATVVAYVLFTAAVIARVAGPFAGGSYLAWLDAAAAGWIASFALFNWVYWPILTSPRVDA